MISDDVMLGPAELELLQFDKLLNLLRQKCFSARAAALCASIGPSPDAVWVMAELHRVNELKLILAAGDFFPSVEHDDTTDELGRLSLQGALLDGAQLLRVMQTAAVCNTMIRFLKGKRQVLPALHELVVHVEPLPQVVSDIDAVVDHDGAVKNSASPELARIRRQVAEKRRESDRRFYHYVSDLRKKGYLRENEEGFFNGRRTLAVLVEYKSEVPGFVHGKSESGKTIFIEPGATIAINNEAAELEIDEQREVNRVLRELCLQLHPHAAALKTLLDVLVQVDLLRAKALLAIGLNACLPAITQEFELHLVAAVHPLLYLQNKALHKTTVPLHLTLDGSQRVLVISGPNAGGKTIALKTVGLLQIMLQSGLLVPVHESSRLCFFEKILIDIGDTQSIENELSTYSAKLKSMTRILEQVNEATLVLMDEFGSGTDPDLGSAIAESVLESLVSSQTRGIITSHFGNVKVLAEKLDGAVNGCMLFDIANLAPRYVLNVGEPGSSYTFEVAERVGFPKHLIERAKAKVDKEKIKFNKLLAEMQDQKTRLDEQLRRAEHEEFLKKMAKEKYHVLFNTWEEKINKERERKIELAHLATFGSKYLRLMEDWNQRRDRKEVIKRFIDGITAESKKQEELKRQKKRSDYSEKKIARIKPVLKVGSRVKVLNGNEVGVVEDIRAEKAVVRFGLLKMTVGMENLMLAD